MAGFSERLARAVQAHGPLLVGIDPHLDRLPEAARATFAHLSGAERRVAAAAAVEAWSLQVIEGVAGRVAAVKPQVAFFEQLGAPGWAALENTCRAARNAGLLVILDAKRGDIGSTAAAYCQGLLADDGPIGADAVTLSPYLGPESLTPFVETCANAGKGAFILLRTSNPGAEALQGTGAGGAADEVARWLERWNHDLADDTGLGPLGAVVGATLSPEELAYWRAAMPTTWMLVPGVGAQGAGPEDTRACFRADGLGALVNASRAITFPSQGEDRDPVAAIRQRASEMLAGF